jgi:hypothetical protein
VLVALADMRRAFPAKDLLEYRMRGIAVEDRPTFDEKQTRCRSRRGCHCPITC